MIKVVLFDLDDTLISEFDFVKSGYKYCSGIIAEKYGFEAENINEMLNNLFNESSKNVFNRLLDSLKIKYTNDDIAEFVGVYRNHKPDIALYGDVIDCISALKAAGKKVGIITDGFVSTQRNKLEAVKADEIFDKIIISDELGIENRKPAPLTFSMMKDYFGVDFDECVYVGDNPKKDFFIRKTHGVHTIRIVREYGVYKDCEYLENVKEEFRIESLNELEEIICEF